MFDENEFKQRPTPRPIFPFGKYKGLPVSRAETDYLLWVYSKAWFHADYPHLRWPVAKQLITRLEDARPSPPVVPGQLRIMSAAEFAALPDEVIS